MSLTEAVDEHLKVVERCVRIAGDGDASPFFLASCMAVFDCSWTLLRARVDAKRDNYRTSTAQLHEHIFLANTCFQYMAAAAQSEFDGDRVTAKVWLSALAIAEKTDRRPAGVDMGQYTSSELAKVFQTMGGLTDQSAKSLWDAISLVRKLRWRSKALYLASCGSVAGVGVAAVCAEIVVKSWDRLYRTQDRAVITLLEMAIQTAEPHLQRFYLVERANLPPSLESVLRGFFHRATEVPVVRNSLLEVQKELEKLAGERGSYLSPRLVELHDELVVTLQAEMAHCAAYLGQLEEGNPVPVDHRNAFESVKHFLRSKLAVAKPVTEQLQSVARKICELKKCAEEYDADGLTALELRCWVGVENSVNAALDDLLDTSHNPSNRDTSFFTLKCVDAELRVMVVDGIIGAARQYQRDVQAEWRPEVKRLLTEAARWARFAAQKTLESIEATTTPRGTWDVDAKWRQHYHTHSDRCAQLYARAATERRLSYLYTSVATEEERLKAAVYGIASAASEREADIASRRSGLSAEEDQRRECRMSEIHSRYISLIDGLLVTCDLGMVEVFCQWAGRALTAPDGDKLCLHVTRQVHGVLAGPSYCPEESTALKLHQLYRQMWLEAEAQGMADEVTRPLRLVLDQFECEIVYDVDYERRNGQYRYTGQDCYVRANVVGAVVGLNLASSLLTHQVVMVPPGGALLRSEDALLRPEDREHLQADLDKIERLVTHLYNIRATGALWKYPNELKDTKESLISAVRSTYEAANKKRPSFDYRNYTPLPMSTGGAVSEYKARVLTLLPNLAPDVAQRAWGIFFSCEMFQRCVVNPDEYEIAIDAMRTGDLPRLDAVIRVREAETARWKCEASGQDEREDSRRTEGLSLKVKRAQLELAVLEAQHIRDSAAIARLRKVLHHIAKAIQLTEEVARLPELANSGAPEAAIEYHRNCAEEATADPSTPAAAVSTAGTRRRRRGGRK
jgi:hypothetical protein